MFSLSLCVVKIPNRVRIGEKERRTRPYLRSPDHVTWLTPAFKLDSLAHHHHDHPFRLDDDYGILWTRTRDANVSSLRYFYFYFFLYSTNEYSQINTFACSTPPRPPLSDSTTSPLDSTTTAALSTTTRPPLSTRRLQQQRQQLQCQTDAGQRMDGRTAGLVAGNVFFFLFLCKSFCFFLSLFSLTNGFIYF